MFNGNVAVRDAEREDPGLDIGVTDILGMMHGCQGVVRAVVVNSGEWLCVWRKFFLEERKRYLS